MRPLIEELSRIAPIYVSAIRMPDCRIRCCRRDFRRHRIRLAPQLREWAQNGWLNIVGGCCGTTPAHIKVIAEAVRGLPPRMIPTVEPYTRLSGLEAVTIRPESNFVNIGERTNVTGSPAFAKLILPGDYETPCRWRGNRWKAAPRSSTSIWMKACWIPRLPWRSSCASSRRNRISARVPIMVDSSKWEVLETGLKNIQGKAVVNSISLKEGEAKFLEQATLVRRYGAAVVVMAFDERGQADTPRAQDGDLRAVLQASHGAGRLSARGHYLRSEHPDGGDRDRGAQ